MYQDVRNFLVTSDYPMDIIVWDYTGEIVANPGDERTVNLPHELPYAPLTFGIYSIDDGETWVSFGESVADNKLTVNSSSDGTNVTISYISLNSAPAVTALYKVWAYAPAGSGASAPSIIGESRFHINTDYNYSKLVYAGTWDAQVGNDIVMYEHNLGYVPQAQYWLETTTGEIMNISPEFSSDTSREPTMCCYIDDNKIYFSASTLDMDTYPESVLAKVHFRIYGDEVGGDLYA